MHLKLPVKSRKFNALVAILGIASLFCPTASAQVPDLDPEQESWIASQIFANECSRQVSCLTSWNAGEDFPSLGLGHFIWYRRDQVEIYTETFPDLLHFYHEQGIETPNWITELPSPDSPWQDRQQFYREINSPPMVELRAFLAATLEVQARFISRRQRAALPAILAHAPTSQRRQLTALYEQVAASKPPYGIYALIDYVNFKGEGTAPAERYGNRGWGLLQVLQFMLENPGNMAPLNHFVASAEFVLRQRVANAPTERNEERWLTGWLNRLATYRPPDQG